MPRHVRTAIALLTGLALHLALPTHAAGKEAGPPNALLIPQCSTPPVIDGTISPGEWDRAAAVTGFQHIFGYMTERQPVAYVTYDDEKIYVGFHSVFPKGSKLRRVARERDHKRLCADDTVEIFLAPDINNWLEVDYQFLGNSLEVIQDFEHHKGIGNKLLHWNGEWEYKCGTGDGWWDAEVAIELSQVGLDTSRDFGINVTRDYAKYIFTNWTRGGFRNYVHAKWGGTEGPAVQLLDLGQILEANMAARIAVCAGSRPAKLNIEATLHVLDTAEQIGAAAATLEAAAGKRAETVVPLDWRDKEPAVEPYTGDSRSGTEWTNWMRANRKTLTLVVTDVDTQDVLLRHTLDVKVGMRDAVQTGPQRQFEVFTDFYPSYGVLRTSFDIFDFPRQDQTRRVAAFIRPQGQEVVFGCGQSERFKLGYGEANIPHAPMPSGTYEAVFVALDENNQALAREVETFEKTSFPWESTQIAVSDEVIPPFTPLEVRGRSVFCWGREYRFADDGLLQQVVTRDKEILDAPVRLTGRAEDQELEFEPFAKLELRARAPGIVKLAGYSRSGNLRAGCDIDIEYDGMVKYRLKLAPDKPLTVDRLTLEIPLKDEHALLYHACGESIRLSNRAGYVPTGRDVVWTSKEVPNSFILGTFIPYFWLGDYDRGLCWMADSDRNWVTDDGEACVEFVRRRGRLSARVNLFQRSKRIEEPREFVFALMAGPPAPEPSGWRHDAGDRMGWYYRVKTFQGYGRPPDLEKFRTASAANREQQGYGCTINTSPNDLWGVTPANLYYAAEWHPGLPTAKRNDYVMYWIDKLAGEGLIDGLYSDDTYPVADNDLVTGRGYVREDGKVQGSYSMFALRDFYKRSAYLFYKHKMQNRMRVHMTDAHIMPAYSFWRIKMDNEWGRAGEGVDEIDAWPLGEICARTLSRQYGMAARWHTVGGDALGTLLLLHDILGRAHHTTNRTLPAKLLFGFGAADVEFLGYWLLQPGRDPQNKDVKVSAWVRKTLGTAMVTVGNLSQEDVDGKLRLPLNLMGLRTDAIACDAEDRHTRIPLRKGVLSITVPRHNYRLLLIGPPGTFPVALPPLGARLMPTAEHLVPDLSDDFDGPALSPRWRLACSPTSDGAIEVYRRRLKVTGSDYKFAAAEMDVGMDNVAVQARIEVQIRSHQNTIGLALIWPNGRTVFAGQRPHHSYQTFYYTADTGRDWPKRGLVKHGSPVNGDNPDKMHQFNWVKIALAPETITFYGSADGETWAQDWVLERPEALAGAPKLLRLGKDPAGREQRHRPAPDWVYFDDLFVTRCE